MMKADRKATLKKEIDNVLDVLDGLTVDDPQYEPTLQLLERLYKLKTSDSTKRVSADSVVGAAGSIAGILMILNYERVHVVASKALGFVLKTKL